MKIYNYSHPLTPEQLAQLAALIKVPVEEIKIVTIRVQIDQNEPIEPQIKPLLPTDHENDQPVYMTLPGLAVVAALLVDTLRDRYGAVNLIRLKPAAGPLTGFELAEVIQF